MRMTIESKDTDDENTQAFFEITKKTRCTSVVDDFAEHAARLVREYHEFVSIANGVDQQDDGDYSDSDEDSGEETEAEMEPISYGPRRIYMTKEQLSIEPSYPLEFMP